MINYYDVPALSNSYISKLLDCPKVYKDYIDGVEEKEESKALIFGNVFHTLVLEPQVFDSRYLVTELDGRTNAYKQLVKDNPDKKVISAKDYDLALMMVESLKADVQFQKVMENAIFEQEYYFKYRGVDCKMKTDIVSEVNNLLVIADVKSTEDSNPKHIAKSIADWGYYRQNWWYSNGYEISTGRKPDYFIFFFVSKKAPYIVTACILEQEDIAQGELECNEAIDQLLECQQTGIYPCYTKGQIITISMPNWAKRKVI